MRLIKNFVLTTLTLFLASAAGLALAQVVVPPAGTGPVPTTPDPSSVAGALLAAIQGKHWAIAVGLGLSAIIWVARKYALPNWAFAQTDRGGALLTLFVALVSTVGAELAAGIMSWATILDAVVSAMTAAGGFNLIKKIISPSDVVATSAAQTPAAKP